MGTCQLNFERGILESDDDRPVSDEYNERQTVAEFMRTWGWTRGIRPRQFIEQPVRWRTKTLLMLFSGSQLTMLANIPRMVENSKHRVAKSK